MNDKFSVFIPAEFFPSKNEKKKKQSDIAQRKLKFAFYYKK